MKKWWQYQKERFPLIFYVPFAAVFCYSTMCFVHASREWENFFYLWFMTLTFFWLFRIADEHKDYEEDCILHPDRPVQRKLVTLFQLRILGYLTAAIQCSLTVCFHKSVLLPYGIVMGYFFLMTKEFYVKNILTYHPYIYGALHQIVLILTDILIIHSTKETTRIHSSSTYTWYEAIRFLCFFLNFCLRQTKRERARKAVSLITALFMGMTCCLMF